MPLLLASILFGSLLAEPRNTTAPPYELKAATSEFDGLLVLAGQIAVIEEFVPVLFRGLNKLWAILLVQPSDATSDHLALAISGYFCHLSLLWLASAFEGLLCLVVLTLVPWRRVYDCLEVAEYLADVSGSRI